MKQMTVRPIPLQRVASIKKRVSHCSGSQLVKKDELNGLRTRCNDPAVFAALLKSSEPMKTKTKKMAKGEFEDCLDDLQVSVRYAAIWEISSGNGTDGVLFEFILDMILFPLLARMSIVGTIKILESLNSVGSMGAPGSRTDGGTY